MLESGQPRAEQVAAVLRHPLSAEETTAEFEALRLAQADPAG
jgi:hypothetical protein